MNYKYKILSVPFLFNLNQSKNNFTHKINVHEVELLQQQRPTSKTDISFITTVTTQITLCLKKTSLTFLTVT